MDEERLQELREADQLESRLRASGGASTSKGDLVFRSLCVVVGGVVGFFVNDGVGAAIGGAVGLGASYLLIGWG